MLGASKAKSTKDTNNFTVFAHYLSRHTHEGVSQKSNNTPPIANNTTAEQLGFSRDEPGPPNTKKVPHHNGFGTFRVRTGLTQNGEGGIRTHEGVTPTRFRVVRNQPDSATSPHTIWRLRTLVGDPQAASMGHQPATLLR